MKNTMEKSEYKAILHSKRANIYYLSKIRRTHAVSPFGVDCRIGSLETYMRKAEGICPVDCRIGSLETADVTTIETLNCISGNI